MKTTDLQSRSISHIVLRVRSIASTVLFFYMGSLIFPLGKTYGASENSVVPSTLSKTDKYLRADEYFSEIYQGEILISVNVLGAVTKPGVYHIPKQTDLIRLFALAGGTRTDADLDDVSIRRRNGEVERVLNVSLKQLVSQSGGGGRPINLEANDVILVGPKEPLVSNNTLAVVTLITSVLGVVVSGIVISNQLKGK